MSLPGVERVVVDVAKICDYLLASSRLVGRLEAVFFESLEYTAAQWESPAMDPRRHAMANEARPARGNEYGIKYEDRGTIDGPAGRAADVVAVRMVLHGEDVPRFVAAYRGARP